jgi:hypothetical protein
MLPDISSPGGFFLGVLGLVGVVALVYALYRSIGSLSVRSKGTDKLAHELSRIATALELLARQRQEASEGELHPDAPPNIPIPVHRPDARCARKREWFTPCGATGTANFRVSLANYR